MTTYLFEADAPLTGISWQHGTTPASGRRAAVDVRTPGGIRTSDGIRTSGCSAPAIGTGLPMSGAAVDRRPASGNPQSKRERTTPGNTPPGALSS